MMRILSFAACIALIATIGESWEDRSLRHRSAEIESNGKEFYGDKSAKFEDRHDEYSVDPSDDYPMEYNSRRVPGDDYSERRDSIDDYRMPSDSMEQCGEYWGSSDYGYEIDEVDEYSDEDYSEYGYEIEYPEHPTYPGGGYVDGPAEYWAGSDEDYPEYRSWGDDSEYWNGDYSADGPWGHEYPNEDHLAGPMGCEYPYENYPVDYPWQHKYPNYVDYPEYGPWDTESSEENEFEFFRYDVWANYPNGQPNVAPVQPYTVKFHAGVEKYADKLLDRKKGHYSLKVEGDVRYVVDFFQTGHNRHIITFIELIATLDSDRRDAYFESGGIGNDNVKIIFWFNHTSIVDLEYRICTWDKYSRY